MNEVLKHTSATIIFVGNKLDLEGTQDQSFEDFTAEVVAFAKSKGCYYIKVSAKTGEGVDDLFQMLVK